MSGLARNRLGISRQILDLIEKHSTEAKADGGKKKKG